MYKNNKLLVIEDDELSLKPLIKLLEGEGYQVDGVPDGRAALERAKNTDYALVITDVKLPGGMDGIETVRQIKEIYPDGRRGIIVITGYADSEAPIRAIRVGVDDFIYKPFEPQQLLHSIKRSLQICRLEQEKDEYYGEMQQMRDKLEEYSNTLEDKVRDKTKELILLFEVGREITASLKLDKVLAAIVERTADILQAKICCILLFNPDKNDFYVAAARGVPKDIITHTRIVMGESLSGWVLENRTALFLADVDAESRFSERNEEKYYSGPFMSVPLIVKNTAIGVLNVNCPISKEVFEDDDLDFLKGVADHASIAIENARLYTNLEKVYLEIITTLTSIIEMKDHYTKRHSERVTRYAVSIAKAMGLSENEVELIDSACQLHDLGKISVHEHILTKPGKLTNEEWNEIKNHPLKGADMLKPLTFLNDVVNLVEQHHERFDGTGYPYGYKGEDIKLGARIMAVADSFDAMTTDRPYAEPLNFEEAISELKRCKGSQFDPKIVDIFVKILRETPDLFDNPK